MEVDPAHVSRALVEADVVEAFEAGTRDGLHSMVWYQEVLLPAHEQMLALEIVLECEIGGFSRLREWAPGREACPMLEIYLLTASPSWMCGLEQILWPYYLSFKECCQSRVIVCEACAI